MLDAYRDSNGLSPQLPPYRNSALFRHLPLFIMVAFYEDSRRKTLFHERANQYGPWGDPTTCEVGVLEWSPGKRMPKPRTTIRLLLTAISGCPLTPGEIISTNVGALPSRDQPRIQIV